MGTAAASNQRSVTRREKPVCTWVSFPDDGAAYATITVNIGAEGAMFCMVRPVTPGQRVHIALDIEPYRLECDGVVRWSRTTSDGYQCFGVQFCRTAQPEVERLVRYVCA